MLKKLIIIVVLIIVPVILPSQNPPPPPPGHGMSGNVPGGGAPIAGGIGILLLLGAAYGGKKIYDINNRKWPE